MLHKSLKIVTIETMEPYLPICYRFTKFYQVMKPDHTWQLQSLLCFVSFNLYFISAIMNIRRQCICKIMTQIQEFYGCCLDINEKQNVSFCPGTSLFPRLTYQNRNLVSIPEYVEVFRMKSRLSEIRFGFLEFLGMVW